MYDTAKDDGGLLLLSATLRHSVVVLYDTILYYIVYSYTTRTPERDRSNSKY